MTGAGRSPALRKATHQARLQAAFLRLYDQDPQVEEALVSLLPAAEAAEITDASPYWKTSAGLWNLASQPWDRRPPGDRPPRIAEITAFVRAADELAARFGLDRLGEAGPAHIFAWCERHLRARPAGSVHASTQGPARLSTSPARFSFEPDMVGLIDAPWQLERWDPTRERRRDARMRLERLARDHLQEQLDRIEAEAVAAGLTFPDTAPNLRRDLGWLYRKVRFRASFQAIYDSVESPPLGGVDTVRKAVLRIAGKVGVDSSGWETGWR